MKTNKELEPQETDSGKVPSPFDCYIVIWEDRHLDTTAHPFMSRDAAIKEAIRIAKEYCRYPEDYFEVVVEGWEFCINYSCEGDSLHVVEAQMNQPILSR